MLFYVVTSMDMAIQSDHTPLFPDSWWLVTRTAPGGCFSYSSSCVAGYGSPLGVNVDCLHIFGGAARRTHSHTLTHTRTHASTPTSHATEEQTDRQTDNRELVAKLACARPSPGQFNLVSLKSHFLCHQSKRGKFLFAQKKWEKQSAYEKQKYDWKQVSESEL